jgi:anti-sigma-K factor RskA
MNGHETFDTLAAVYAVGALDGEDLSRFEAHLAEGCAQCASTLRESHEALARLALAGTPAVPPAAVKAALLPRVGADPRAARRVLRRGWLAWTVATAAVVGLVAMLTAGIVATRYEAQLGRMARETAAVRERLQRDEAALREQMLAYRNAVELLGDPATRVVELRGSGPAAAATARLIWNDKAGGHLLVANLPPAPSGKAYELWTLGGVMPTPAGVFQPDASGRAAQRIEPVAGAPAKGFAVTIEPAAGSVAPTGPIVLAAK